MCNHKKLVLAVIVICASLMNLCPAEAKHSTAMELAYRNDEPTIIRDFTVIDYEGNPVKGAKVSVLCSMSICSGNRIIHKQVDGGRTAFRFTDLDTQISPTFTFSPPCLEHFNLYGVGFTDS